MIVDNELPTALFRRDIQSKWIITTSLVIVRIFNMGQENNIFIETKECMAPQAMIIDVNDCINNFK